MAARLEAKRGARGGRAFHATGGYRWAIAAALAMAGAAAAPLPPPNCDIPEPELQKIG